jgi:hypothetical protein
LESFKIVVGQFKFGEFLASRDLRRPPLGGVNTPPQLFANTAPYRRPPRGGVNNLSKGGVGVSVTYMKS